MAFFVETLVPVFPSQRDGAVIGRGFSPCFTDFPMSRAVRYAAYLRHAILCVR